jgi:hypothetical protein
VCEPQSGRLPFIKILIPFPVKRICLHFDFQVSCDGDVGKFLQSGSSFACVLFHSLCKYPLSVSHRLKVFVFHPLPGLVGMSPECPPFELQYQHVVNCRKCLLGDHMFEIVPPSRDDRVEPFNQLVLRYRHVAGYYTMQLFRYLLAALLRGFDQ